MGFRPTVINMNGPKISGLTYGGRPLGIGGGSSPSYEQWVDLPYEYYLQGDQQRWMTVNLTGMPQTSDKGYFTMVFDAKIWGSTGGAARIVIQPPGQSEPQNWRPSNVYAMWDHFQFSTPPAFFAMEDNVDKTWTTDPGATQYVTVQSWRGAFTSLWPENTYKPFKLVCDRANHICHVYIDGVYLGYVSNFSNDLLTWNIIYLYSDQGRSYEIAAVKNIKVAGFSDLASARAWEG